MRSRHRSTRQLLLGLGVLLSGLPAGLRAQDSIPAIPEAKLRAYAAAWIEIGALREEINGELGRTHDEQGKAEIRARLDTGVAKILETRGFTAREYERITYVISLDGGQRAAFEKVVAELTAKKGGAGPAIDQRTAGERFRTAARDVRRAGNGMVWPGRASGLPQSIAKQ